MDDPLIGIVVLVGEERGPILRYGGGVDSITVVLGGGKASSRLFVHARLVMAAVSIPVT